MSGRATSSEVTVVFAAAAADDDRCLFCDLVVAVIASVDPILILVLRENTRFMICWVSPKKKRVSRTFHC